MAWWERSPVRWFEEKDMRRDEKSMTVLKVNGIGGEDDFTCGCRRKGTSTLASWDPLSHKGQFSRAVTKERVVATDEEGGFAHRDVVDSRIDLLARFHADPTFPVSRIRQLRDPCSLGEFVVREEGVVGVAPLGGEQGADEWFGERYGDKDQVIVPGKESRDGFCEHVWCVRVW